jgi:limonene-1,2-epoxide hydrolase
MDKSIYDYFTPRTVWENVGMSRTVGFDEAMALLTTFEQRYGASTISTEFLEIVESGNKVFTERLDHMIDREGRKIATIRVAGIFEIENDKIVRWRDYFNKAAVQ